MNKDVKVCVYDNPNTMCRECWMNGKIVLHYSINFFFQEPNFFISHPIDFRANIGNWVTGQVCGDVAAIDNYFSKGV